LSAKKHSGILEVRDVVKSIHRLEAKTEFTSGVIRGNLPRPVKIWSVHIRIFVSKTRVRNNRACLLLFCGQGETVRRSL